MSKINLIMYCEEVYSLFSGEFSKSRFGGAGLQMFFLASEFAKDPDINVTFVFCRHDVSELSHESIRLNNFPKLIQHGIPGISRIINENRKAKFVSFNEEQVVFMTTMATNTRFACDFAKTFDAKTILRVASDTDILAPIGFDQLRRQELFDCMGNIDQLVVQSEFQKKMFKTQRGYESVVIKNGIPISEPKKTKNRSHILWVASAQELKQPHYFLDLAAAFPQEKFVMVMPYGVYPTMDGLEKRAQELNNLELMTRQLTLDEVNELFSTAKIFVNTSALEGFPNTFLQAASAGTPIVSLSINPDQVLTKNNIGASADGDVWKLPSLLKKMIEDEEYWRILSDNGPEYIRAQRDIVKSAQEYKKIMQILLKDGEVYD